MSTALHINTIHDIVTAVEKSDSSHGIFTSNSTMRKRARYLCSEAHTLLSMLKFRGEMDDDTKAEYEYVYARYQRAAYHTNARAQLDAAQHIWSFALSQARDTSHRLIADANRASRIHRARGPSRNTPRAPVVPPETRQRQHAATPPVIPPDARQYPTAPVVPPLLPHAQPAHVVPPRDAHPAYTSAPRGQPPPTSRVHRWPAGAPPPAMVWPPPHPFGSVQTFVPVLAMYPAYPHTVPDGWAYPRIPQPQPRP